VGKWGEDLERGPLHKLQHRTEQHIIGDLEDNKSRNGPQDSYLDLSVLALSAPRPALVVRPSRLPWLCICHGSCSVTMFSRAVLVALSPMSNERALCPKPRITKGLK
jgi:hypothetical protein